MALTSATAPGKIFLTRSEIADHYKSDWHKYNLKRREAGLPLVEEREFQMRLEAALAMRKEQEKKNGTSHIKDINSKKNKKKQDQKAKKLATAKQQASGPSYSSSDAEMKSEDKTEEQEAPRSRIPAALAESQENPEIDPLQSLFDNHKSKSLKENLHYMQQKFGFFVPDKEFLVDVEGLLGYCHEKVKLGHYCLYCNQVFPTWQGCQQHMIDKQHAKLRYEQGFWDELDPFYDFGSEDKEFVAKIGENEVAEEEPADSMDVGADDDDDGWEDVPEGEEEDDEEMYQGYEREIKRFGLNVNALGELVFPDGRVVGHRALRRYYKQKLSASTTTSLAIVAAKKASGERLYGGQVVNIHDHNLKHDKVRGAGRGILVAVGGGDGPATFSALSLYRYRAAIRKQRKGDFKGQKIRNKAFQNINRMDKKANRLMNGVSVAHAAR